MIQAKQSKHSGQGITEYFLLGAVVVMISVGAVFSIGGNLSNSFGTMVPGKATISSIRAAQQPGLTLTQQTPTTQIAATTAGGLATSTGGLAPSNQTLPNPTNAIPATVVADTSHTLNNLVSGANGGTRHTGQSTQNSANLPGSSVNPNNYATSNAPVKAAMAGPPVSTNALGVAYKVAQVKPKILVIDPGALPAAP